jgi:hypothetical protein
VINQRAAWHYKILLSCACNFPVNFKHFLVATHAQSAETKQLVFIHRLPPSSPFPSLTPQRSAAFLLTVTPINLTIRYLHRSVLLTATTKKYAPMQGALELV